MTRACYTACTYLTWAHWNHIQVPEAIAYAWHYVAGSHDMSTTYRILDTEVEYSSNSTTVESRAWYRTVTGEWWVLSKDAWSNPDRAALQVDTLSTENVRWTSSKTECLQVLWLHHSVGSMANVWWSGWWYHYQVQPHLVNKYWPWPSTFRPRDHVVLYQSDDRSIVWFITR